MPEEESCLSFWRENRRGENDLDHLDVRSNRIDCLLTPGLIMHG